MPEDTNYKPPHGNSIRLTFGGPYAPPVGSKVRLTFSTGEAPPLGDDQYLFPSTFDSSSYGSSTVKNDLSFISPPGISAFLSGQAMAWRFHSYIGPSGIAPPAVGNHSIINQHRNVYPSGFDALGVGALTIINRNRHVFAGNIVPPQVPQPNIWLYTRYLLVGGFNAGLFGAASITHERRYLLMQSGIAAPGMGNNWISEGVRILRPAGVFLDAVGRPGVGGTRYITPDGWDAATFGERIIPESQSVYPLGFRESWGDTLIRNQRHLVEPSGFHSTRQEQYRWGQSHAWNRTQYVYHMGDPLDGLSPPPWPLWTAIENRNKAIGAIGAPPPSLGYPHIDNNARLLAPAGIAAPAVGVQMVSHKERTYRLDGVEPPPLSGWAAIYNAARVLAAQCRDQQQFGDAEILNTRRTIAGIGDIASLEIGEAFIAYAIRRIEIESRYSIAPPDIRLPEVKLHTRYIDGIGYDAARVGNPSLSEHRNVIRAFWPHSDRFGWTDVRNATPEVHAWGAETSLFGEAQLRTQWRAVAPHGYETELFGRADISDRTKRISVPGRNMMAMGGGLSVIKTGAPPYSQQNVICDTEIESGVRFGIPGLNQQVLRPLSIAAPPVPEPTVRAMAIQIDAGIKQDDYGVPLVSLKNRRITVEPFAEVFEPSAPRLSPHTIYAVKEAPAQAKQNHPSNNLHYVGESGIYPPGERFGNARISNRYNLISGAGGFNASAVGQAELRLGTNYIEPAGIKAYRMGWVIIGDGKQEIAQFASRNFFESGAHKVARGPYLGPQTIALPGVPAPLVSLEAEASHRHRTLLANGHDALVMGSSRGGNPYQWQSLHVGVPMPTIPRGFSAELFGTTWISLKVREVQVEGFDDSRIEYDHFDFAARLRVRLASQDQKPPTQTAGATGAKTDAFGTPNARAGVHYIRPDGNAEQFRKGAF